MSFTQAALIIVALAAVALGLICYHLLSRLHMLERAVTGGLEPPTRRLSREEFEQRFSRALARSRLAAQVESGVVLALGADGAGSEMAALLNHLGRGDDVYLISTHDSAQVIFDRMDLAGALVLAPGDTPAVGALGITVTPFAFIIDASRVTAARPLAGPDDLIALLERHT